MNLRGHVCGALILLSTLAIANEKITLRWNVKPEDRYEYQIQLKMDAGDHGFLKSTIHFAERVVSVQEDRIVSSAYVPDLSYQATGDMEAARAAYELMKGAKFEFERDSLGKSLAKSEASTASASAIDLVLPKESVGIGDTWANTFHPNDQIGDVKVTYTLEKFDQNTATIRADMTETEKLAVVKPYRFVVERASGRYRSAEGAFELTISGVTMTVSFSHRTIFPSKLRSNGA